MPQRSDEPLRKVTLNLYEADCRWFEKEYGHGWTERLRQHVHAVVNERQMQRQPDPVTTARRLGDLQAFNDPMWPDDLGESDYE